MMDIRLAALAGLLGVAALASGADLFVGEQVPVEIARMVERGQTYLVRMQGADGVWSNPRGTTGPAIQGLALLALLADGEDPRFGRYAVPVRLGTEALLQAQDENGYFGPSMYHHAFATLALAELYGAVDDPRVGIALQRSVALILDARERNQQGAWRYRPENQDADTTVSGGQLVALFAARNAGIEVPETAIEGAMVFFRSVMQPDGGVGYTGPQGGGSGPRNAIAVVVLDLAGRRDDEEFRKMWSWLLEHQTNIPPSYSFYYFYYAAQAYFRADMVAWRDWNKRMADRLRLSQNSAGGWDGPHGSVFCTASAILTMAPNYRYLPIYER